MEGARAEYGSGSSIVATNYPYSHGGLPYMKRIVARIGLVALTAALTACTGGPTGSASFVPQNPSQAQSRHPSDIGGGGPVGVGTNDIGGGGPVGSSGP